MTTSIQVALFVSSILTGFYSGIGFFGFMSFLGTLERMPVQHLIPFWRLIDGYMGRRMRIFGPLMLLSLLVTLLLLTPNWQSGTFWLVGAALLVLVVDVRIAISENIPVNQAIQDRTTEYAIAEIEEFRITMVRAFYKRSALMILCFVLVNLACFFGR
jgi:uncharacterized membrane protein